MPEALPGREVFKALKKGLPSDSKHLTIYSSVLRHLVQDIDGEFLLRQSRFSRAFSFSSSLVCLDAPAILLGPVLVQSRYQAGSATWSS